VQAINHVAGIAALIVLLGCAPEFPAETPGHQRPDVELTVDDRGVYDALVVGYARDGRLLGRCADPPPDQRHELSPKEIRELSAHYAIYLKPETERFAWPYGLSPDLMWSIVGSSERKLVPVPNAAFEDYKQRNAHKASLAGYSLPHLSVIASAQTSHRSTLALSLPGYAPGRNTALVSVFCTPTFLMHGGLGEFNYLEKHDGIWRLVATRPMWIN
jgi:hypothetical protein